MTRERREFRRSLRRGQTDAEAQLWALLRGRRLAGTKFRRQHPFGPYVLDLYCVELGLAIEADGAWHWEELGRATDAVRDAYLGAAGVRVLRFSDHDVLTRPLDVAEVIWEAVQERRASGVSR